jgi:hypothetical protein
MNYNPADTTGTYNQNFTHEKSPSEPNLPESATQGQAIVELFSPQAAVVVNEKVELLNC